MVFKLIVFKILNLAHLGLNNPINAEILSVNDNKFIEYQ